MNEYIKNISANLSDLVDNYLYSFESEFSDIPDGSNEEEIRDSIIGFCRVENEKEIQKAKEKGREPVIRNPENTAKEIWQELQEVVNKVSSAYYALDDFKTEYLDMIENNYEPEGDDIE